MAQSILTIEHVKMAKLVFLMLFLSLGGVYIGNNMIQLEQHSKFILMCVCMMMFIFAAIFGFIELKLTLLGEEYDIE